MLSDINYNMTKRRSSGSRLSDTNPDATPPKGMTPTKVWSGQASPAAAKTMMLGMTVMAEGPAGGATAQAPEKLADRVGESETGFYMPLNKLGEGGMGAVYLARMKKFNSRGETLVDELVAIKVVKFDQALEGLTGEERERRRDALYSTFMDEIKLIYKLTMRTNHPNIVRIIDVGEDFGEDKDPFCVMEYLKGQDLEEMVRENGPLQWEMARPLMVQVSKALEVAHNNKEEGEPRAIVHRDIKPENVFIVEDIDGDPMAKLLDFGIAKVVATETDDPTHGGGMIMGTPAYMAPEQAQALTIDNRTDIYGVGAMMYHLLTGTTVFDSDSVNHLLYKAIYEEPTPLRERRPDLNIPVDAERIVMKCLEKAPEKRYQTMRELRDDMMRTMGMDTMALAMQSSDSLPAVAGRFPTPEENGAPVAAAYVTQPVRRKRKLIGWLVGLGTLAVAGTVAATMLLSGGPKKSDAQKTAPPAVTMSQPMTEPIAKPLEDAGVRTTPLRRDASAPKKRTVTFRVGLEGVRILAGKKDLCATKADGTCRITLPKGQELTVTLEKKGYKTKKIKIFSDTSGSIPAKLDKKAWSRRRRRKKQPMLIIDKVK